jgi:hypothetical protein
MTTSSSSSQPEQTTHWPDCVELGEWTKIPVPPPASLRLALKEVDKEASHAIKQR